MIHLTGGLLLVLEYGLSLFAFVDVLRADEATVPWMPRWGWVIGILVFPLAGAVTWIAATNPWRTKVREARASSPEASPVVAAPEPRTDVIAAMRRGQPSRLGSLAEDAAFLAQLWDVNEEHERTLRRWEEDLRRREERLRLQQKAGRDRHMDAA